MVSRRLPVLALALVAMLFSACGSGSQDSAGDFSGEAKQVASTIDDLQDAGRKRDAEQICSRLLATALVEKIKANGKRTCESTLDESLKDVDAFDLEIVKNGVSVNGNTATAKVRSASGSKDRTDVLGLVREPERRGGKTTQVWKLSALAG